MAFITWNRGWDPLRELDRQVDRLFESIPPLRSWRAQRQFPAINVFELDDEYLVTAELPGVSTDDLDISLAGQVVTLTAKRGPREDVAAENYRRRERPVGTWTRSISLPGSVARDRVSAEVAAGILKVHLPKTEDAKPRQIPVSAS
jgi:HSP20 family protein